MNKRNKINGFRFVTALAAAELELRKQETDMLGYSLFDKTAKLNQRLGCHIATAGQAIKTYNDAMDYALCFVMRYHANTLLSMAKQPLGCSDSAAKRKAYIWNKQQARAEAERLEDDEYESEEDAYKWAEEEAKRYAERAKTEEHKARMVELRSAQKEAHKVASWAAEHGYKDPWDLLLELSNGTLTIQGGDQCDKS